MTIKLEKLKDKKMQEQKQNSFESYCCFHPTPRAQLWCNYIFTFIHLGFFHFHEFFRGWKTTNMGIIRPILVDAFKHFKIVYAQLKAPYVCPNICIFSLQFESQQSPKFVGLQTQHRIMYFMGSPPCKWISAFLFNDFLDLEN